MLLKVAKRYEGYIEYGKIKAFLVVGCLFIIIRRFKMIVSLRDLQWKDLEEVPNGVYQFQDVGRVDLTYKQLCDIRELERMMLCEVFNYWKREICANKYIEVSDVLVDYDTSDLFSVRELVFVTKYSVYAKMEGKKPSQNDCNRVHINLHETFLHDVFVRALHDGSLKDMEIRWDLSGYSRSWELPVKIGMDMCLGNFNKKWVCYKC